MFSRWGEGRYSYSPQSDSILLFLIILTKSRKDLSSWVLDAKVQLTRPSKAGTGSRLCTAPGLPDRLTPTHPSAGGTGRRQPPPEAASCRASGSEEEQAVPERNSLAAMGETQSEKKPSSSMFAAWHITWQALQHGKLLASSEGSHVRKTKVKLFNFPLLLGRHVPALLIPRKLAGTNYQKAPSHLSERLVFHKGRMDQLSPQTTFWGKGLPRKSCAPMLIVSVSVLAKPSVHVQSRLHLHLLP